MSKSKLCRCLTIMLGAVFLVSAVAKLFDMQAYFVQISHYGIVRNPFWVKLVGTAILALEWILGIFLVGNIKLKGWTIRAATALLLVFTGILLYGWLVKDLEDCGCFGSFLALSPAISFMKSLFLLALAIGAWFLQGKSPNIEPGSLPTSPSVPNRSLARTRTGLLGVACILPLVSIILLGPTSADSASLASNASAAAESPGTPFGKFRFDIDGEWWDLSRGRYLVAMLSDSCDHCAQSVAGLNEIKQNNADRLKIIALCLGEASSLERFRNNTGPLFPTKLIDPLEFFNLIGSAPPRFYWIEDGKVIEYWDDALPSHIPM